MDWKLILQIAGVVLGLLYLWLEYRADIRLWIVGLVMPLVHGALYYKRGCTPTESNGYGYSYMDTWSNPTPQRIDMAYYFAQAPLNVLANVTVKF